MGDDSLNEYLYKFVTAETWNPTDANAADLMAIGDKYLDHGRLYVAKFFENGTGEWIELAIGNPAIAAYSGYRFADQADVMIKARLAADAVGATKMDKPEWCAVHPRTGEIYYTMSLTNSRKIEIDTAPDVLVDAPNPRSYVDPVFAVPNIQHPGERVTREGLADPSSYQSHWPGNTGYGAGGSVARPLSATVVIMKTDGGVIGVA